MEGLPKSSIDEAVNWLRKKGYSDNFIKRFKGEAIVRGRNIATEQAIDEAFRITRNAVPGAGITAEDLKNFQMKKLGKKAAKGAAATGDDLTTGAGKAIREAWAAVEKDPGRIDEAIDIAHKQLTKSGRGTSLTGIKRVFDEFVSRAKLPGGFGYSDEMLNAAINKVFSQVPGGGITPSVLKNIQLTHPTVYKLLKTGIVISGYIMGVLTVFLGFISWIPSVVLGIYLVTEDRTRFHGIAIILIGFLSMIIFH